MPLRRAQSTELTLGAWAPLHHPPPTLLSTHGASWGIGKEGTDGHVWEMSQRDTSPHVVMDSPSCRTPQEIKISWSDSLGNNASYISLWRVKYPLLMSKGLKTSKNTYLLNSVLPNSFEQEVPSPSDTCYLPAKTTVWSTVQVIGLWGPHGKLGFQVDHPWHSCCTPDSYFSFGLWFLMFSPCRKAVPSSPCQGLGTTLCSRPAQCSWHD